MPHKATASIKNGSCPSNSKITLKALTVDFPNNNARVFMPANFSNGRVSSSFSSVMAVEKKPMPASVTSQKLSQTIFVKKSSPGALIRELVNQDENKIKNTIPIQAKRNM